MRTIVFAASKGGAGKSTLLFNVAMTAAKDHSVLMADLDPQRSLRELWERRGEILNPRLVSNITDIPQSIKLLTDAGLDREYFLVDTPGSFMKLIEEAIAVADLIVLPVQTSFVDMRAQEDLASTIESLGMMNKTMFVLNRTTRTASKDKAKSFLSHITPHPIYEVKHRDCYMGAGTDVRAGCESNKAAGEEIAGLWTAIKKRIDDNEQRSGYAQSARGRRKSQA